MAKHQRVPEGQCKAILARIANRRNFPGRLDGLKVGELPLLWKELITLLVSTRHKGNSPQRDMVYLYRFRLFLFHGSTTISVIISKKQYLEKCCNNRNLKALIRLSLDTHKQY